MKTLPLILVCLTSGAVGATATRYLSPAAKASEGENTRVADLSGAIEALRSEMKTRDDSIRDLSTKLQRMESEADLVSFIPERTQVPEDSTQPRGDAIPAALGTQRIQIGDTVIPAAQFENWVRQASDNIREQERIAREEERKVREGERTEERIAQLTTELGLDTRQQSEFRRFFEEQNTKRREMMDLARDAGGDRQSMRESFTKLRDAANADLQSFLSGDQYERYQASNQDFGGFGGPGGGGRGGRQGAMGGGNGGAGGQRGGGQDN